MDIAQGVENEDPDEVQPVLEAQPLLHLPGTLCQRASLLQTTTWSRCDLQTGVTALLEYTPGCRVEELP
jgi:hypothetical protein